MSSPRQATLHRRTAETTIDIELVVDGSGTSSIDTGVPFFDHMLTLFAKHGLFDLKVKTVGDIEVDFHHTVEDTGIVLGQVFRAALGNKAVRFKVFYSAALPDFATWRATRAGQGFDARTFEVHARPATPIEGARPGMSVLVQ